MAHLQLHIDYHSRFISRSLKDEHTIQQARELVPISELVQNNLEVLDGDYQTNLLPILVDWFNSEFFSWFQPPLCEKCNKDLEFSHSYKNTERLSVELYECPDDECDYCYRFVRHVDPAILLVTRKGRCGEWANCFLIFLKALGYDSRLVLDVSDHVWNEVWSEVEQRWIHVDPCENTVDTPLLYEVGWSKELSYCFAFGEHHVLDVTPRYTTNYTLLKSRRILADERWLDNYLDKVSAFLLQYLPAAEREIVLRRREKDRIYLKELLSKPTVIYDKSQFQGRKTGSMAWRIERNEFHPILENLVVIEVNSDNATEESVLFQLKYNSFKNLYQSNQEECKKKNWSSLTYRCENLDYKFEKDWKTAYIARYEDCPANLVGSIRWRFNLSQLRNWSRFELLVKGKVYPNTLITLTLKSYDTTGEMLLAEIPLELDSINVIHHDQIKPTAALVDIIAELMGGDENDEVAWQKPQLFRQARAENTEWPFDFKIY